MTETELQFIADSVREFVAERVAAACSPLLLEIRDLREQVRTLPVPVNGKDVDPELVRMTIASEVTRQVDQLPKPKDGIDGVNGKDGSDGKDGRDPKPEEIQDWVRREVKEFVDQLPKPKDGVDGMNGKDGRDGKEGINGEAGMAGPAGIQGLQGANGRDGKDGRDGLDVDMVEVRAMVTEMFTGYPVPKDGASGTPGRDGKDADPELIRSMVAAAVTNAIAAIPTAAPGAPGKDADPIHPDTLRLMVVEAVREEVRAIPAPKDGDPGQPGRDSLEIDILPSVDPAKSYPRGTFACYEGGLIRAIRNTVPITTTIMDAGWAVIVEGFANPEIEQGEDLRSFVVSSRGTSGLVKTSRFKLPTLIYRGIFQEGTEYSRGDTVTWAGSSWHCEAETTKDKPGEGATAWRLMVKQGRPGKDAEPKRP